MKLFTRTMFDMASGEILASESRDYAGPVARLKGSASVPPPPAYEPPPMPEPYTPPPPPEPPVSPYDLEMEEQQRQRETWAEQQRTGRKGTILTGLLLEEPELKKSQLKKKLGG